MHFQSLLACLTAAVCAAQLDARAYYPTTTTVAAYPTTSCAYASKYCKGLVGYGQTTKTVTTIIVTGVTVTPTPVVITRTLIIDRFPEYTTTTVFDTTRVTTTTTTTQRGTTTLPGTTVTASPCYAKRDIYRPAIYPPFVTQGCGSVVPPPHKLRDACSCYLGNGPTVTQTNTITTIVLGEASTSFTDVTIGPPPATTITITVTSLRTTLVTATATVTSITSVPGRTVTVPCPTRTPTRTYY